MVAISVPSNNTSSKNSKKASFLKFGCSCSKHWHIILESQARIFHIVLNLLLVFEKRRLDFLSFLPCTIVNISTKDRTKVPELREASPNIYKPSMGPLDRKVQWRSLEGRLLRNDRALMTLFLYHKVT